MPLPMLRSCLHGIFAILLLALVSSQERPQDPWYPSKNGAQDTLGALNKLNSIKRRAPPDWSSLAKPTP